MFDTMKKVKKFVKTFAEFRIVNFRIILTRYAEHSQGSFLRVVDLTELQALSQTGHSSSSKGIELDNIFVKERGLRK